MNLLLFQSFKQHNNTLTKFEAKPTRQPKKTCQSAYAHEQKFDKVSEPPLGQSFIQHNNTLTKFKRETDAAIEINFVKVPNVAFYFVKVLYGMTII